MADNTTRFDDAAIAALPETDRARLVDLVRAELTARSDGSITTSARANAIKACAPG